jgi:tetratricopeptide (TPR) repeat protein
MKKIPLIIFVLALAASINAQGFDSQEALTAKLNNARNDKEKIDIYLKLADLYKENNDNLQAIKAYQDLIDLEPKKSILYDALIALGDAYLAEKRYAGAIETYKTALQLKYGNDRARLHLAQAYEVSDLNDLALVQFIKILSKNKKSFEANYRIAELYMKTGSKDKAIKYFMEAIKIKQTKEVYRNLAICYEAIGKLDDAIGMLKKAAINGEDYQDMLDFGRFYSQKKDYITAEEQYKMAIKIDKNKPDAYIWLGLLNLINNDNEKALVYINTANSKSPNEASIHFLLSFIYNLKKDAKLTKEELILAKEYSGENGLIVDYIDKFQGFLLKEKGKTILDLNTRK